MPPVACQFASAISDDEKSNPEVPGSGRRAKSKNVSYAPVPEDADEDMVTDDIDNTESDLKEEVNGNGAGDEDGEGDDGDEGEEGEEGEGDLDEDEYVVEKILSHYVDDSGSVRFEVKWEGFDKKADRTWEPEENLAGTAAVILEEYFSGVGGREKLMEETISALKGKKRGRAAGPNTASKRSKKNGDHPGDGEGPASLQSKEFKPPAGSWDHDVDIVDMYRDEAGGLMVYLTWKNGHKTQHPAKQAYQRCPQKILQFYESKINFKTE